MKINPEMYGHTPRPHWEKERALWTVTGRRAGLAALLLILVAVAWHQWDAWSYPTGTLRYKVTVELELDGQALSGSSVLEARYRDDSREPWGTKPTTYPHDVRGEAVALDLGARGMLFAAVTNGQTLFNAEELPVRVLGLDISTPDVRRSIDRLEASADIPRSDLPVFARFRDVNDPATVEIVDPARLESYFGPGIRLKRMIIATTDEPVTKGLEIDLPWVSRLKPEDHLNRSSADERAAELQVRHFRSLQPW